MPEKAKAPAIRFKGFTDAWEQRKLGQVGKTQSGIGFPDAEQGGKSGLPFFKVSDMNNGGNENEMLTANNYVSSEQIARKKWNPIDAVPAVMFAKVGAAIMLDRKRLVRTPFLLDNNTMAYILDGSWGVGFVKTLFETINLPRYAQVGALPSYNGSDIEAIDVTLPDKDEQSKIGVFFVNLDNFITLHQRKLLKLKNVKKAMLEKMFPKNGSNVPEIRFAGFTDAWEQRKLIDFVDFYNGLTYSPNSIRNSGTLVLRSSNVSNGEVTNADNVYVDSTVVNSPNVCEGDIIIVVRNGSRALIGKHAQIKRSMPNTVIGAFMTGARSECPEFLNALLNTPNFDKEIAMNIGATINQITGYMFSKMEFMIPTLEEQTKIGNYFDNLDNLIALHRHKLEKLKNVKKAFLDKMFV